MFPVYNLIPMYTPVFWESENEANVLITYCRQMLLLSSNKLITMLIVHTKF